MKFSRIIFVTLFPIYFISCQNGIGEKRDVSPKENTVPATEYQKTEKSFPKLDGAKPGENQTEKEVKPASPAGRKKRLKAIDTLKPITAIP